MPVLTAMWGREVDCSDCHRPVSRGARYWTTDSGDVCDDCFRAPPLVSYSSGELWFFGVATLLIIIIVIVALGVIL